MVDWECLGRGRVVAHSGVCQMTSYEPVRCGRVYHFRRRALARHDVPLVSWTAGWWRHEEAYEWPDAGTLRFTGDELRAAGMTANL